MKGRVALALLEAPMQSAKHKAHVDVVGGLATLAPHLGLDGEAVVAHYPMVALATEGPVRVSMGRGFDWLSVMAQRTDSPPPGGSRRELFIELEARAGTTTMSTVEHRFGKAAADVDVEFLASHDVCADVVSEAVRRVGLLDTKRECAGVSWHRTDPERFELHVRAWRRDPRAPDHIRAIMKEATLGEAAQGFIARVHPLLARNRATMVSLPMTRTQCLPQVALTYGSVPFEDILRLLTGAFPEGDFAVHLGELAGAFGIDVAAAFRLELGSAEPFDFRISVDVG